MNLDLATLQVLILALPGFAWTRFTASLSGKDRPSVGAEVISALMYGVITYLCLFAIFAIIGWPFHMAQFGEDSWRFSECINEVLFSLPLAVILASCFLLMRRKQFPIKLLRRIGVTNFSGDTDIWDYCFSELRQNGCFINLRDSENGWIIQGFTRGYSERKDLRELVLDDVEVFDEAGEFLFRNSAMYVGRQPDKISVDFYEAEGTGNGKTSDRFWKKISDRWKTRSKGKAGSPQH